MSNGEALKPQKLNNIWAKLCWTECAGLCRFSDNAYLCGGYEGKRQSPK